VTARRNVRKADAAREQAPGTSRRFNVTARRNVRKADPASDVRAILAASM